MEIEKNIISIICETHTEMKEKIWILKNMLTTFDKNEVWDETSTILMFFNTTLVKHFKRGDILISMLYKIGKLSEFEKETIDGILQDHKTLLDKFDKLNEIIKKFTPYNHLIREKFIEIYTGIIDLLLLHADKEDKTLYPIARRELKKEHLNELEKKIKTA